MFEDDEEICLAAIVRKFGFSSLIFRLVLFFYLFSFGWLCLDELKICREGLICNLPSV